ncbi:molybdopterin molybdotransferase MoeA [Rhabdobacter roseus]|uniref:Molybdopterin molybdenumtransferase n=1 Tax=Rhabdobacter roseus TaxID=1655419 RepID=A0A840TR29_9BACT|nr:gephyrin-like molybdotransferase Glp [Rhabdobacter roseus]MBB5285375.1 molybdopterin molybdotransferase [Rhabdobacter roseus]
MVTVQEAKQKVLENTFPLPPEDRAVTEAVGYVLAEEVLSPLALPAFRQSSMDGYAVHHEDITPSGTWLPLVAESRAGTSQPLTLARGTAIRIFTGAPVPEGATAIVIQEKTELQDGSVHIQEYPVAAGQHIRNVGQQIREGDLAMPAGTFLTPGSVGFLLGMNVLHVKVHRQPSVGILVTGDELIQPGEGLRFGQVYESNSAMLVATLLQEGITQVSVQRVLDDPQATRQALEQLTEQHDVVLATGGVSVGEYDFVGTALGQVGVETIFYKVRQRPGKPLLFGKKGEKLFFALPGNPAASLVCFYEYVLPALRRLTGRTDCFLPTFQLPITHPYSFRGERDELLKATATPTGVTPLEGQESFILRSFAVANALIYLPASQPSVQPGELVEVHLLPFFC